MRPSEHRKNVVRFDVAPQEKNYSFGVFFVFSQHHQWGWEFFFVVPKLFLHIFVIALNAKVMKKKDADKLYAALKKFTTEVVHGGDFDQGQDLSDTIGVLQRWWKKNKYKFIEENSHDTNKG